MELFLWVVGAFAVGSIFGWFGREAHAVRQVKQMLDETEEFVSEEVNNPVMTTIEIHGGYYYMYSAEDGSFLAQGLNRTELSEALRARFPDKTFVLSPEQYKDLGFKDVAF